MNRRQLLVSLAALATIGALTGCGLQPARGTSNVTVTVTRDFGAEQIGAGKEQAIPSSETVGQALRRFFRVTPGQRSGSVDAIGRDAARSPSAWAYYVNGVAVQPGATNKEGQAVTPADTLVHPGDRIWWDLHDSSQAGTVPAVVGSFPEPFVHGLYGQRYPTTLECADDLQSACDAIGAQLTHDGVPVADQALGTGSGQDTLAIVVATWPELEGSLAGYLISAGPGHSGVYAGFTSQGDDLELLNPEGQTARVFGPGAGLIAATNDNVNQPEWLITGTDDAGVRAAAAALTPANLRNHFAVAVVGKQVIPLPVDPAM